MALRPAHVARFTRHVADRVTVDDGRRLRSSQFGPLTWAFGLVEVSGLEPPTSTMRKYGSQRFDQALSEDFPGSSVSIPSGSLTIPPLPSR